MNTSDQLKHGQQMNDTTEKLRHMHGRIKKNIANARYLMAMGKPEVVLRYIGKMITAKGLGRITPRQIDIALTFDCNLVCDHCFTFPMHNPGEQEMDRDTLKRVAGECRRLGITVIHFTGGEILLRQDLEDIIRLFEPRRHVIYIQSNGTLATRERLRSLKKAGLDFFGVSLEYPDKTRQDTFRHHLGYYDKALAALDMAQSEGLMTSVNLTLDRHLIRSDALPTFIESLGRMGHIVYGNLPVPVGRYKDRKDLLWFNNERSILETLTRRFPFFRTEFDSNFGPAGCPAMKEKIYLCAYGDVLACPYIHVSFGNVKTENLSDIYKRCLSFDVFKTYHDHCLAAENRVFIERIIDKTLDFSRQPVFYNSFEKELTEHPFTRQPEHETMPTHNPTVAAPPVRFEPVACPSCGSLRNQPVITAPDFETGYGYMFHVVRCEDCDLCYTSPRPSTEDLFTLFYPDNYVCYTKSGVADSIRETYLGKSRLKALTPVFKRLRPDGSAGRFLDVGCSYGYFLSYLKTHTHWDVKGCEPNRTMAETARHKGLDVRPETLVNAGYDAESFDLVYMSHVLEHVPDLKETVAEVFRILKPGGIFITENPDLDAPIRPRFGAAWWGYHLPRHLTHFTCETLSRVLGNAGFHVERITPCFRPGPIAWSVQNFLKSKGYPDFLCALFGVQNPVFVAMCGIPALSFMKKGHTDMMETLAVKPQGTKA